MSSKDLYKVLISLNRICIEHAKLNSCYAPKIKLNVDKKKDINKEIQKTMNYLKHPYYSYLNK